MVRNTIPRPQVVVLGAGVIGLRTALSLLEQGVDVTIVARDWPGDANALYTSMWAGAASSILVGLGWRMRLTRPQQWRSTSDMYDTRGQDWGRQTYRHWVELAKSLPAAETGLEMKSAIYFWSLDDLVSHLTTRLTGRRDYATPKALSPEEWIWWTGFIPSYTVLPQSALPSKGKYAAGISYDSFTISPAKYLHHLLTASVKLGAKRRTSSVQSIADVLSMSGFEDVRAVVNCTGLGAGKLVHDSAIFPTKGQSVIVKGQAERITSGVGDDWEAVVVPRSGANQTFLGVSKIPGDWSLDVDENVTRSILDRCRALAPELLSADGQFDLLSVQPTGGGGSFAITMDIMELGMELDPDCVGTGRLLTSRSRYETSFGAAKSAVDLVMRELGNPSA